MRSAWNRRWGGYLLTALLVASVAASCGPDADARSRASAPQPTVAAAQPDGLATDLRR